MRHVTLADDRAACPKLIENTHHFGLEIHQQLIDAGELIGSAFVVPRAMPVIVRHTRLAKARTSWWHAVGIVETDEAPAGWIVQSEGIAQSVRPFRRRLRPLDLELEPIALFEMVYAAVERQEEFQCMLVRWGTSLSVIMS